MKKKILARTSTITNNDKPATKSDLRLVKSDLQKEVKEVKEEIQQVRGRLENRIDQVELGFSEKLTQFKSDILDGVDKVYGELVALREESTIHQGQHDRTGETLEDHEKRIQSLETHPKIWQEGHKSLGSSHVVYDFLVNFHKILRQKNARAFKFF